MTEKEIYQPFIEEINGQKVVTRPLKEKIGWGCPIQIIAKLGKPETKINLDWRRIKR